MQMRLEQAQLNRPSDPNDPGYESPFRDKSDQDEQHQASRKLSSSDLFGKLVMIPPAFTKLCLVSLRVIKLIG